MPPETICPICGSSRTRALEPNDYALSELRPPLGPRPFPTSLWTFITFVIFFIFFGNLLGHIDSGFIGRLHGPFEAVLSFLVTAGIYHEFIKPICSASLDNWHKSLKGAFVCAACWAAFKPS